MSMEEMTPACDGSDFLDFSSISTSSTSCMHKEAALGALV
jgi:hypothetical protein